jgi:ribose-phosphate pyrophosphokinase
MIIPGSSSASLSRQLASELNMGIASIEITRFPDDECYVRLHSEIPSEVIIVQNTHPDRNIMELFLLQNAAREAGAEHITTVIPYYGYCRQDKKFQEGESISARKLAHLIQQDSDLVITIDPHKPVLDTFFGIPILMLSAISVIAHFFNDKQIDIVLAPDRGALQRAQDTAVLLNSGYDYLEKKRLSGDTVIMESKTLDVKDKNVLVIDDIISTGGTMALAIHNLKKQKAKAVYAACSHGLFIGQAVTKIKAAGCTQLISTDTLESPHSHVSVASVISEALHSYSL